MKLEASQNPQHPTSWEKQRKLKEKKDKEQKM